MKDTIRTPKIKPKKKILPYIFIKPSSLENKKDKIQEICKKFYGYKVSKSCLKYKTVKKLLDIQENYVDKMALDVLEHQLKQISTLIILNKEKSLTEYKFYTKLEFILRTLFLERGEPFWYKMFESTKEPTNNILNSLYNVGWCYVAKKEIPDIWKHCLLNDLEIFSEEEKKKVVGIIGTFLRYRMLPDVEYV